MRHSYSCGLLLILPFTLASLSSSAADQSCIDNFNRYVRVNQKATFFVLELSCDSGKVRVISSFGGGDEVSGEALGPDRFAFEYKNGYRSIAAVKTKTVRNVAYREVDVQVHKGAHQFVRFSSSSNVIFDQRRPKCSSRSGDGGFVEGTLDLSYPRSTTPTVVSAATRYGWFPFEHGEFNWRLRQPTRLRRDRLFDSPESCTGDICNVQVYVGFGNELFAIDTFNSIDRHVCARLVAGEAGGPPIHIAGIPLNTLTDHSSPATAGTRQALKSKVIPRMFGARAITTEPSASGPGKTFVFSVLGPNQDLSVSLKNGYWYKSNISISVGLDANTGALGEAVYLTVLDLVEIRAPEALKALPSGVLASGRTLEYLDSGNASVSADGKVIENWSKLLATKVADATGGFVEGS